MGAGGGLSGPGCGLPRPRRRPRGGASRTGLRAPDALGLLGTRPSLSRGGRSGGFWAARSGAPRGLQLGAPDGRLGARAPRSLLPALFIFQRAEPGAARRCLRPSERESARRLTPWPPAGPAPPGACPAPGARRTPRGAQGSGGAGRGPPGLGGAGERSGCAVGARGAAARSLRPRRGARGRGGASLGGRGRGRGRAGGGRGPGRRAASCPLRAPGSARAALWPPRLCRCRRCASAPFETFPPALEGFFYFSFLLRQGSREPRGEASPRTFKGAVVWGLGELREVPGTRTGGGVVKRRIGLLGVPSPSGPSVT